MYIAPPHRTLTQTCQSRSTPASFHSFHNALQTAPSSIPPALPLPRAQTLTSKQTPSEITLHLNGFPHSTRISLRDTTASSALALLFPHRELFQGPSSEEIAKKPNVVGPASTCYNKRLRTKHRHKEARAHYLLPCQSESQGHSPPSNL